MLNSDFWRDIAKEFRALDPTGQILWASWRRKVFENGSKSHIEWGVSSMGLNGRSLEASFAPLASRAGIRLAPNAPIDRLGQDVWLDAIRIHLKSEGTGKGISKDGAQWEGAKIERICPISVELCNFIEAWELDKERSNPATSNPADSLRGEAQTEAQKQFLVKKHLQELEMRESALVAHKTKWESLTKGWFDTVSQINESRAFNPSDTQDDVSPGDSDPIITERMLVLADFIERGRKQGISPITDEMITKAASPGKWNGRSQIGWWKRNNKPCNAPCDRKIRSLLAKEPRNIWPDRVKK